MDGDHDGELVTWRDGHEIALASYEMFC